MQYQPISLREANHNFSRLIAAVERGEAFCITRRGQEVARLIPSPTPVLTDKARSAQGKGAGANKVLQTSAAMAPPDPSLGERVRQLEARLDKLSSAQPPTDE